MAFTLSNFADEHLGQNGVLLTETDPNCFQLGQAIGAEYALPLIATIFWQAFMNSPAFSRSLARAGASFLAERNGEKFIITHGNRPYPRLDLLVFDPGYRHEGPGVVMPVEVYPDELRVGWRLFARDHYAAISARFGGLILRYGEEAALEVLGAQPFGLLVAVPPSAEPTASSTQAYAPSPAWGVALAKKQNPEGTIGVIAQDVNGTEGVTTALHVIPGIQTGTKKLYVNSVEGTLNSQDTNCSQDSCFIEIAGIASPQLRAGIISTPNAPVVQGPLKGVTPRVNEQVRFESWKQGGQVTTQVIGWSPDIPWYIKPDNPTKILTDPDSQPGDSGTAILDGNDYVLGFSHYVSYTGPGGSGFSAWMWAESIFEAHKLQY